MITTTYIAHHLPSDVLTSHLYHTQIKHSKSTHFFVTTGTSEREANLSEVTDRSEMKVAVTTASYRLLVPLYLCPH